MITDEEIKEAAEAFASVTAPDNPQRFIEDFEMGAKWMRYKLRKEYEQTFTPPPGHRDQDKQIPDPKKTPGTRQRA